MARRNRTKPTGLGLDYLRDRAEAAEAIDVAAQGRAAEPPSSDPRPSRWRQQRARLFAWILNLTLRMQATGRKTPALLQQFRHSDATPIHPLWQYLPEQQRSRRNLDDLRRRRLWAWLKQKRQRIALVLILYVLLWCIPLLIGEHLMTVVALLPLLLVPPVGYLVYWLVWKEFHA